MADYQSEEEFDEDDGSEDTMESDLDSEAEIKELMQLDISDEGTNTGKHEYLQMCTQLKIVPVAMFIAKLECEHINLRHHGVGIKGAQTLAAALKVNTKIRSLNLGDNWFGDQGVAAIAEVLKTNVTITSLNLSDNRVRLAGVNALCLGLQDNNTLTELSLKGNSLDDRAATPLAGALHSSTAITRLDLSYNNFSEEAGRVFGGMLADHSSLLDFNLKWNSLRAKGGAALAEKVATNRVLNRLDIGWNGLGDAGAQAISEMLATNNALTHVDVSHNRINLQGAIALAEGIKTNDALMSLELGFNPMGMQPNPTSIQGGQHGPRFQLDLTGVDAIVNALRANETLETVGLSNVQSGGSYRRGRASRFDPKNPDGHYVLDLAQPWDFFIAETLYERMVKEVGETWMNQTFDGATLELPQDSTTTWQIPHQGVLEFDYVTWKRGLEATFTLELSNPCDLFLGEQILKRTRAHSAVENGESCRECKLNGSPFEARDELPAKGKLYLVYFCTKPQEHLAFHLKLNLAKPEDKVMALRLWERALTNPTDTWNAAKLDGAAVTLTSWQYPEVPSAGEFEVEYAVKLAIKPTDRGLYFSAPMSTAAFQQLLAVLSGETLPDFDKVNLIKQAASRNYLTAHQVKSLLESVSYRKGKLEVAVMLYSRTVDQNNFVNVLQALNSEADRQAVLDQTVVERGGRSRRRRS